MPLPILQRPLPLYSQLAPTTVLGILTLIALFLRFPFFFRDYVDRDESTFIIMAQSWVDGHLPYTFLWDLKPPLTFGFFALIITVFGKSILAIRFFGALLVVCSAFFTYKIAESLGNKKIALWSSVGCVALLSLFGSLQGVMSEHICMAFFMPALYFLTKGEKNVYYIYAGLLMGITIMVKLNMAYPVLALGILLFSEAVLKKNNTSIWAPILLGASILLIICTTYLPYYWNGYGEIWWEAVVQAPTAYTEARRYPWLKLAPFIVPIFLFFLWTWKKKHLDYKNRGVIILTISILGVLLSFVKGGRINGHYLIQLHPLLLILVFTVIPTLGLFKKKQIPKIFLLPLFLIPAESYLEYVAILKNKIERGTFYNGEGFTVPEYIIKNRMDTNDIFFLEYHIGYWVLGKNPPTMAATHPSNLCRDELYPFYEDARKNSLEELRFIMESLRPETLIKRKNRSVFDKKEVDENALMDNYLASHYRLKAMVGNAEILELK